MWLILFTLFLSETAFADDSASMKLWDVNVNNRAYYHANANILPFFRNVQREGVRISA